MMGWGGGGGWGMFGGLSMLLWWGLIIVAVFLVVRWLSGGASSDRRPAGDPALEILRERYARGEISKEEFDAHKRHLS